MMRRRKNVLKKPLQSEQEFAVFLKRVRNESGVSAGELAEGLMEVSQLSRIENEIRPVPKAMRDRLLGRLGVTPDMYENLLNNEDYAEWEWVHKILRAIDQKEIPKAEWLIREYEMQEPADDKVKRQFCILMQAELLKLRGTDQTEMARRYEKAVRLTVPDIDQIYAEPKRLSVPEVNMILEYEYYKKSKSGFAAKCRYWAEYMKDSLYDELSMAKIYSKIVYYYLTEFLSDDPAITTDGLQQVLQLCDDAVELLRNTGRAFYLVELLECRGEILAGIVRQLAESGKQQEAAVYQTTLEENSGLEKLLKELYMQYDVPAHMQDCTYLYQQRWVYATGDVLRIRRTMLGLTQEELCSGICSVKALRRAEQKRTNLQREPLEKILKRLGLSKEIQKANIVTNDRNVLELMTELSYCRNNHEIGRARMLLEQLNAGICAEIPENRQYVMEAEASLDLMEGRISKAEFAIREKRALQCTLDTERVLNSGRLYELDEVYLTETEMTCLRKRIQGLDQTEKRKQIDFLLHFFGKLEKADKIADYVSMYEFVMECATSELGNMGEYQLATELDRKTLQATLGCRRIYMTQAFLYDILWNHEEQQACIGQQIEKEKVADSLRQCMILSHFNKQTFYENLYLDKLHQVTLISNGGLSFCGEINSSSE